MRSLPHDHKTISKRTNDSVERLRRFTASHQRARRAYAAMTAVNGRALATMFRVAPVEGTCAAKRQERRPEEHCFTQPLMCFQMFTSLHLSSIGRGLAGLTLASLGHSKWPF